MYFSPFGRCSKIIDFLIQHELKKKDEKGVKKQKLWLLEVDPIIIKK